MPTCVASWGPGPDAADRDGDAGAFDKDDGEPEPDPGDGPDHDDGDIPEPANGNGDGEGTDPGGDDGNSLGEPQTPESPAAPLAEVTVPLATLQDSADHAGDSPLLGPLDPPSPGSWVLALPGGRRLTVRFDVVPTYDCDHRYQASAYQPGDRLRRLVQVRDHQCTFPACSRPARESDFEHAIPYDKGGTTDACNAGARSRRCHQVKQSPGWTVTQPKPGWHLWTTPTGRSYTQEPWRYTA